MYHATSVWGRDFTTLGGGEDEGERYADEDEGDEGEGYANEGKGDEGEGNEGERR